MAVFLFSLETLNITFCLINHFYVHQSKLNQIFIYFWDAMAVISVPYLFPILYLFYLNQFAVKCIKNRRDKLVNWCVYESKSDEDALNRIYCALMGHNEQKAIQFLLLDTSKKEKIIQNLSSRTGNTKQMRKWLRMLLALKLFILIILPSIWFFVAHVVCGMRLFSVLWILQLFLSLFVLFFGHMLGKRHNYYEFVRYLAFSDDEDEEKEYATFEKLSRVYTSMQQLYPVFVCLIDAGITMDIAQIIMQYVPAIAVCKKSKAAHNSTWLNQF